MRRFIFFLSLLAIFSVGCQLSAAAPATISNTPKPSLPSVQKPANEPNPTAGIIYYVTAVQSLNVRYGKNTDTPVKFGLMHGAVVEVIGQCVNGWVRIMAGGRVGWVNASYLSGDVCN